MKTKYNTTVDNLIAEKAEELRNQIRNLKSILNDYEQKLADLEPDETDIKTLRKEAEEALKAQEKADKEKQEPTPQTNETEVDTI